MGNKKGERTPKPTKPLERTSATYKDGTPKKLTPKQIRARARRAQRRGKQPSEVEFVALYGKPIEEWDMEELARGRCRDKNGQFRGPAPKWITREIHEKSMEMFRDRVKIEAKVHTIKALDVMERLLEEDEVDDRGKPLVPASVKADIAKFLFEHLLGKPTQPVTADINVRLQGILANVMVDASGEASSTHRQIEDIVDADVEEDEEEDDE